MVTLLHYAVDCFLLILWLMCYIGCSMHIHAPGFFLFLFGHTMKVSGVCAVLVPFDFNFMDKNI